MKFLHSIYINLDIPCKYPFVFFLRTLQLIRLSHKIPVMVTTAILFLLSLLIFSCNPHQIAYQRLLLSDFQSEGFLGEHIYQVKATGMPNERTVSLIERRKQALGQALLNAETEAVSLLLHQLVTQLQKEKDFLIELSPDKEIIIKDKLRILLGQPKIVYENFFASGKVEIVARFHKNNLMKHYQKLKNSISIQ